MAETTKTPKAPAKPRAAKKAAPEARTVTMAQNGATIGNTNKIDPAQAKPVNVSREEVAKLAHKYWIESGRPHGKHEEHWFRAEQELRHHRHAS